MFNSIWVRHNNLLTIGMEREIEIKFFVVLLDIVRDGERFGFGKWFRSTVGVIFWIVATAMSWNVERNVCILSHTKHRSTLLTRITYYKSYSQSFYLSPLRIDYCLDYFYFYATYGPGNENITNLVPVFQISWFRYYAPERLQSEGSRADFIFQMMLDDPTLCLQLEHK